MKTVKKHDAHTEEPPNTQNKAVPSQKPPAMNDVKSNVEIKD
jgi:hypothetical protein